LLAKKTQGGKSKAVANMGEQFKTHSKEFMHALHGLHYSTCEYI